MKRALNYFLTLALIAPAATGATFNFIYTDASGTGFNSVAAPDLEGGLLPPGNSGATLGEQRRIVLEAAAASWGERLESSVPIVIEARFLNLGGSSTSATLAFASPMGILRNLPGLPQTDTFYVQALANSIVGFDNLPASSDLSITVNSSIDDDPLVLGGDGFYYGLDGNSGFKTDLLVTLRHEIAHGLGFVSLVDESNGTYIGGNSPDAFSRFIRDEEQDALWPELSSAQRTASAINDPDVTFTGPSSNAAATRLLKPDAGFGIADMTLTVTPPSPAAGNYGAETSEFGPGVPPWGLSGTVVLVDDGVAPNADACGEPFVNAAEIIGRIALIDRGTCNFDDKVRRAQDAGAIAAIVTNNSATGLVQMGGDDDTIRIPSVFISQADGNTIKAALPGVHVTLTNIGELAGTRNGSVRLHAPNPVESGSSISHWSPSTYPDQLMEPSIPQNLRANLDLTVTAFRDIGWTVTDPDFPFLTYELWADERITNAQVAGNQDADGDTDSNFREYVFGSDPMDPTSRPAVTTFDQKAGTGLFRLNHPRNRAAADVIFDVRRTDDLGLPFTSAQNGTDYREFGTQEGTGTAETVELQVESSDPAGFYRIDAELHSP